MCSPKNPCGGNFHEDLPFRLDMERAGIGTRRFTCGMGAHSVYFFVCPYPHEEGRECRACGGVGYVDQATVNRFLREQEARIRTRETKNTSGKNQFTDRVRVA